MSDSQRHRVVIVGGGFGGLFAAKFLRRVPVDVTLIDRTNHHLFQPLLYQLATGILSEGSVAPPLREVLRKHRNVRVELAEVTGFDLQAKTVTASRPLGSALTVPYDSLIVAAGAQGSYFGHDEFCRFAPGMKTIDDALELRARIFGAFEMAELEEDPEVQNTWLTFAVIGAGPTGVEMAGQIAELSRRSLKKNFRHIDPASAQVLLFDGGEEPLATFGDKLCTKATSEIERVGVQLRMRTRVTDVTPDAIVVDGPSGQERIACHTKVWSAGVQASPLAKALAEATGAGTDRAGHIEVLPDCTLPGHPEVFVVGDMMSLNRLPGVAEVAMQGGIHAARTIKRRLGGDTSSKQFVYRDLGSMATIARFRAIVDFKGLKVGGFIGWLMWAFIHLTFLTGFKNRWIALFRWLGSFIGNSRDERTITMQQVAARIIAMQAGVSPSEESISRYMDEHPGTRPVRAPGPPPRSGSVPK
ncbi:MAG TPA: NAD(P)/FAD-dependent oxidoreductase [Solirubrobacteraceae bacterium]|nr:NAD(P)/FAD-dependent oxidoreductase [Solirubrobacteraceae bacterium]